jgi:hypothetical protein
LFPLSDRQLSKAPVLQLSLHGFLVLGSPLGDQAIPLELSLRFLGCVLRARVQLLLCRPKVDTGGHYARGPARA